MRLKLRVLLILLAVWAAMVSVAEAAEAPKVLSIHVEGNRYIESETVLAKMKTRVGSTLDRKVLSQDLRTLHKSGYFSDVRFTGNTTPAGVNLICVVKEYPLIADLKMAGNEEFPTKDLQLRMKLRPGRIFSPENQKSDRNLLTKGYLKKGYYQVGIDFVPTPRDDGRIDLLVKVNEGSITHIRRIRFIGNKAFDDQILGEAILSRNSDLTSWFTDRDVFDQKRLGADAQLLQQYYLNHGYLDMTVESTQLVMSSDKDSFDLTFSVHEGIQYRVGDLSLQGDLVPDEATLKPLVKLETGKIYSLTEMQATIDALTDRVGDEGYAFATVTPLLNRDLEFRTVSVVFDIEKGDEAYIERVEIFGNEKSDDQLLRRQIKQDEGGRYSGSQVRRSKETLSRDAYNEDVRVSFPKGTAPGNVNMKVDVKEKRSGKIGGGIGYSQTEKVIFTATLSEENLFGKGYQANLNGTYGRLTQNITGSITDPYFLGLNMSATLSGYKRKTDPLNRTSSYRMDTTGLGLGFGVPITDAFSYAIHYAYSNNNITIVNANATLLALAQQGKQVTGELTQTLRWDTRDRLVRTREGMNQEIRFGFSGVGGNNKFYETGATSQFFFPIDEEKQYIFNTTADFTMIHGYGGKSAPLWRRYSMGGIGTVRGFDTMGISLRDPVTNEAVGGDKQLRFALNLMYPISYLRNDNVRGILYMDAGTVWGRVNTTVANRTLNITEPFALSRMRYSAGLGLEWMSPLGPITMVWSMPLRTMPGDIKRSFEFSLGGLF